MGRIFCFTCAMTFILCVPNSFLFGWIEGEIHFDFQPHVFCFSYRLSAPVLLAFVFSAILAAIATSVDSFRHTPIYVYHCIDLSNDMIVEQSNGQFLGIFGSGPLSLIETLYQMDLFQFWLRTRVQSIGWDTSGSIASIKTSCRQFLCTKTTQPISSQHVSVFRRFTKINLAPSFWLIDSSELDLHD